MQCFCCYKVKDQKWKRILMNQFHVSDLFIIKDVKVIVGLFVGVNLYYVNGFL